MKKSKGLNLMTTDNAAHLLVGLAVALIGWAWRINPWQLVLLVIFIGFGREILQHTDRPPPWLNLHNVGEALMWLPGAVVVAIGRSFV